MKNKWYKLETFDICRHVEMRYWLETHDIEHVEYNRTVKGQIKYGLRFNDAKMDSYAVLKIWDELL